LILQYKKNRPIKLTALSNFRLVGVERVRRSQYSSRWPHGGQRRVLTRILFMVNATAFAQLAAASADAAYE
jgi:hypothetical protein